MHDTNERLSLLWIFALLNYLYADVLALFAFAGSPNSAPHLPQWALFGISGFYGNTHRHDSCVSIASAWSEPARQYNRGFDHDSYQRFSDLRSAFD